MCTGSSWVWWKGIAVMQLGLHHLTGDFYWKAGLLSGRPQPRTETHFPTRDVVSGMHPLFHDVTQGFSTYWEGRCLRDLLLLDRHSEPELPLHDLWHSPKCFCVYGVTPPCVCVCLFSFGSRETVLCSTHWGINRDCFSGKKKHVILLLASSALKLQFDCFLTLCHLMTWGKSG